MHGALTGCERILRTPCPPGYVGVLRVSLLFFLLLLPFVLLEIAYWLIPVVFCTAFVLLCAAGAAMLPTLTPVKSTLEAVAAAAMLASTVSPASGANAF